MMKLIFGAAFSLLCLSASAQTQTQTQTKGKAVPTKEGHTAAPSDLKVYNGSFARRADKYKAPSKNANQAKEIQTDSRNAQTPEKR